MGRRWRRRRTQLIVDEVTAIKNVNMGWWLIYCPLPGKQFK